MKKLLFFVIIIFTVGCGDNLEEKLIPGKFENNRYENKYFTVKLPEGWSTKQVDSPSQTLCMVDYSLWVSSNLIILAESKKDLSYFENVHSFEQFSKSVLNSISKCTEDVELVENWEFKDAERTFSCAEIYIDSKELHQFYYITEVDKYYLVFILTTDDQKDLSILDMIDFQ